MNRLDCFLIDNDSRIVRGDFGMHSFPVHSHREYAICVVDKGLQTFISAGSKGTLNRACFAALNPELLHSGQNTDSFGWHQYVLYFTTIAADRFYEENGIKRPQMAFRKPICDIGDTACRITDTIRQMAEETDSLARQCLFQETLGALAGIADGRGNLLNQKIGFLRRAEEMMAGAPEEQHSLDDLAREAGMSKFHFLRSFRDMTGLTPHAYLTQLRLAKAFTLLNTTDRAVTEIATECGFSDQPHFIRCFKKMWGTTPGRVTRK